MWIVKEKLLIDEVLGYLKGKVHISFKKNRESSII